MQLSQIIDLDTVYLDSVSQSKTAVLLKISQLLNQHRPSLDVETLFDAYWKRESLGSTAIGQGITIPHIRLANLAKPLGCFIRLLNPIDFGALDKQAVDLVIGLAVPKAQTDQHLQLLATIIKQFSEPSFRKACRIAKDNVALYNLLLIEETAEEVL
jgi:PTS system nitrogen regulatory IIA component